MSDCAGRGDVVFVGDVHLQREDPDLEPFVAFLRALAPTIGRLVLAGDLFDLWLGDPGQELPHQAPVLRTLRDLRRRGTIVDYLEGNRDFQVGKSFAGDLFDEATDRGIALSCGGRSIFAIHGDLANAADRQYRAWRRVAQSRLAWTLLRALPAGRRIRVAEAIERRMRGSNRAFKAAFPEAAVRAYAAPALARGHDVVVFGHFHVERDLAAEAPSPPGRILVLPEWKGSRRHLRITRDGSIRFEGSGQPQC